MHRGGLAIQLSLRIDRDAGKSLQVQVTEQLRELILDGRLAPGTRVPASRSLAIDLGVSRNTVTGAYARLQAEGLLEAREPTGTYVAERVLPDGPLRVGRQPDTPDPADLERRRRLLRFHGRSHTVLAPYRHELRYDFWVGRPDAELFPMRTWQALLGRLLPGSARHLCEYGDPQGVLALREQIAAHIGATRGIATDASRILITNGIQEGLNLMAYLLIGPRVPVVVENPCYSGAANVFAGHGAALRPVAVDDDGIACDRLPERAALAYVTPSHQYPLGGTLSVQRREALLAWAESAGAYIAEDDYDSDFFYDGAPLPALKSLDRGDRVIYFGTFSKCLGAGLRIGYMVLPAELREPAIHAKALLNNCQPWLEQAALAEFMAEGGYASHTRRLRQRYGERRQHLCNALGFFFPEWEAGCSSSGLHAAVRLPEHGPDARAVSELARTAGVGIYSIDQGNAQLFKVAADDPLRRVLLFGYAALNRTAISEAVLRLRQVLREGADSHAAPVPEGRARARRPRRGRHAPEAGELSA